MTKENIYTDPKDETFYTVKETQILLKSCRAFIWNLRQGGKIGSIKAGRKVLIPKSSVDAYIASNIEEVNHD